MGTETRWTHMQFVEAGAAGEHGPLTPSGRSPNGAGGVRSGGSGGFGKEWGDA